MKLQSYPQEGLPASSERVEGFRILRWDVATGWATPNCAAGPNGHGVHISFALQDQLVRTRTVHSAGRDASGKER